MPVKTNSTRKEVKKRPKLCWPRPAIAPHAPSAMAANDAQVIQAPPKRSARMPPRGRATDPTSAPRKASDMLTSGNWPFSSVGKAPE